MSNFNWKHIDFADGSNPYICMTKKAFDYMKRNYILQKIDEGFYLATEKNSLNHIVVSYTQNWDCEGYHTTQNIKLSKGLLRNFNSFLAECKKPIDTEKKHLITSEEMNMLVYGKNVDNLNRCLTLTQLKLLYQFLTNNGIDCNRVKTNRNTMLIVV